MIERRLEGRFLCADLVRVEWLVKTGNAGLDVLETAEAVLEDISALGACVQVEESIPPGTAVSISVNSGSNEEIARFSGDVAYSVFRDYGYFVGIVFSGETRWSSGVFEPQHLTSLADLIELGISPAARN